MEVKSLSGLMEIVERTENLGNRIHELHLKDYHVAVPHITVPLSLETTEAWARIAAECYRKPVLAKSRQILDANGISTSTIPADVLEKPDSIAKVLQRVKSVHAGLSEEALRCVARALTNGLAEAEGVISTFTAASDELRKLAIPREWITALAAERIAPVPNTAKTLVETARQVNENCDGLARTGVEIAPFASLDEALVKLTELKEIYQKYDALLFSEGIAGERLSLRGLLVQEAVNKLEAVIAEIQAEKYALFQQAQSIGGQLELVGVESANSPSTIAELRELIPKLRKLLEERRRVFRESLGSNIFDVVQGLLEGRLPTADDISDGQLGNAVRKAVECGYRFQLEAPRENR